MSVKRLRQVYVISLKQVRESVGRACSKRDEERRSRVVAYADAMRLKSPPSSCGNFDDTTSSHELDSKKAAQ